MIGSLARLLTTAVTVTLVILHFPVFAKDKSEPFIFLGNHNIPPIIYIQNAKPVGLVVDLARALAERADLNAEVHVMDWADAQRMVQGGEADALLQINSNPEREKIYDFSAPLLESNFCIFRKDSRLEIQGIDALFGLTVGVESKGYPILMLKNYPQIKMKIIPSWKVGFDLINAGEIDAVIVDRWVGEYELYAHNIEGIAVVDEPVVTNYSAIAVRKDNRQLLERINYGLKQIREDGTRSVILSKWKKKEIVYLPREKWNLFLAFIAVSVLAFILLFMVLAYARRIRKINLALTELATIDTLTGVFNRLKINETMELLFTKFERYDRPFSVIMVDIDKFKRVNDKFGHQAGDKVLVQVVNTIKTSIRKVDHLGRWGGEEFLIISPETNVAGVKVLSEHIRTEIEKSDFGIPVKMTISAGAAEIQPDETVTSLISRVDCALYTAKNGGRNRVEVAGQ